MIYVYQRNHKGNLHLIEEYASPREFARHYSERMVTNNFANDDSVRTYHVDWAGYRVDRGWSSLEYKVYAKVAYNEKDKLLPVSELVGYTRKAIKKGGVLYKGRYYYWNSWSKKAYGGWRHPRTTQERKWAHAWDDEEFCPPPRARRQGRYLPTVWDDIYAHSEKSWKTQSKRRHQWRPK